MVSSRTESLLLGRSQDGIGLSLSIAGGLFAVFVVASLAYHLMMGRLVPGWPVMNALSVVRIGSIEVPYSTVSSGVLLGILGVGLAASLVAAWRNHGLLVNLLLPMAPIVGFFVGQSMYYSIPPIGFQFGSVMDVIGSVGLGVLIGGSMGILGFLVGRAWALISNRTLR